MTLRKQTSRLDRSGWRGKSGTEQLAWELRRLLASKDVTAQLAGGSAPVILEKQLGGGLGVFTGGIPADILTPFTITLLQDSVLLAWQNLQVHSTNASGSVLTWLVIDGVDKSAEALVYTAPATGADDGPSRLTATALRKGNHTVRWLMNGADISLHATRTRLIFVAFPLTNASIVSKL